MSATELEKYKSEIYALIEAKRYPQALEQLNPLIAEYPTDDELYNARGFTNHMWNDYAQAEIDLKKAIELKPSKGSYHHDIGLLYLDMGETGKAIDAFHRALHIDPNDLSTNIHVYASLAQAGHIDEAIDGLEALDSEHPGNELITEYLGKTYFTKALDGWLRYEEKGKEYLAALCKEDVQQAQHHLALIQALPNAATLFAPEIEELEKQIKAATRRKFEGNVFSIGVPVLIAIIGVSNGGFWGYLYGLSALLSFIAFRRPTYLANKHFSEGRDPRSAVDKVMDVVGGNWIVFGSGIFDVLKGQLQLFLFMQVLRSVLTGLFMPFSVFAAFFRNYSFKYAGSFVGVVLAIAISSGLYHNWQAVKQETMLAEMATMLAKGDFKNFDALYNGNRAVTQRYAFRFLAAAIGADNAKALRHFIEKYNVHLNSYSGNNLLQLARQRKAQSVIAYLNELGFGVRPRPVQQPVKQTPTRQQPAATVASAEANEPAVAEVNKLRIGDIGTQPVAVGGGCSSSNPKAPPDLHDLALQGKAAQISTGYFGGIRAAAQLAIDGNTSGIFAQKSVTHTNFANRPWWAVDLGGMHEIDSIVIWNRTDSGVGKRLQNFSVYVLDEQGKPVFSQGYCKNGFPDPALAIAMTTAVQGRYIKVMLNGHNYLHLAEVQVFGK